MTLKSIQIVVFDNPFPANFGGVIDVFYKIKALSDLGVDIYLHAFYDDREDLTGLHKYCKSITLYKRKKSLLRHFSIWPFRVNSRMSKKLIQNLNNSNAPIFFESLSCTGILHKFNFNQKIAIRCHNIEHHYNFGIANSESNILMKIAYYIEAVKFKMYQKTHNKADVVFTLSNFEYNYFSKKLSTKVIALSVFQKNTEIKSLNGSGDYALFHGDLTTSDNLKSAFFLVDVFSKLDFKLIIASSHANKVLDAEVSKYSNIEYYKIKGEEDLDHLIKNAHVNTLYSFQKSGTKLKVFNALFNGRHCIINANMVDDPAVLKCCFVAESKEEYIKQISKSFELEFLQSDDRILVLKKYDPKELAKKLCQYLT